MKIGKERRSPVFAESETLFFYRHAKAAIGFGLTAGAATRLMFVQDGRRVPIERVR